jgi:hypothetical protein
MRLLQINSAGGFSLTEEYSDNVPCYAILSHRWGLDSEEVSFEDIREGRASNKSGYAKIEFCANQAKQDGLKYFWVDTCCINKANLTELSESIMSMFRWYRDAAKCYVYLSDVSTPGCGTHSQSVWEPAFRCSKWFTRGWTLQELIAPKSVEFFSQQCERLGDKKLLERLIHNITGIPIEALDGTPLSSFSIEERMQWAASRNTKREEDKAYCLLGIFDVYMPLMYGERGNAFTRLEEEIKKSK